MQKISEDLQIIIAKLKRKPDCHKGDFGHILIIGGDYNMGGAVIMAAQSACRAGAGKVSVLTRQEHIAPLLSRAPNAMYAIYDDNLGEIFANKTVLAIGMGLGKSAWSKELFAKSMSSKLPKIIDADGLNLLAESAQKFDLSNAVLTPHVGEAARLLKVSASEIQNNRELSVKNLYEKYGATCILKGRNSLVYGKSGVIKKVNYGNPGMASAGMGDILSGIVAAFLAQNLNYEDAALLAASIHGLAGDLVAQKQGEVGMSPDDLLDYIPKIINGKL